MQPVRRGGQGARLTRGAVLFKTSEGDGDSGGNSLAERQLKRACSPKRRQHFPVNTVIVINARFVSPAGGIHANLPGM